MKSVSRQSKAKKLWAARLLLQRRRASPSEPEKEESSPVVPSAGGFSPGGLSLPSGPFSGGHSRQLRALHHLQHEHELDGDLPEVTPPAVDYVLDED